MTLGGILEGSSC